jgi:hypothetical protein
MFTDTFYGDFWRLNIEHAIKFRLSGTDHKIADAADLFPINLIQGRRIFLSINANSSSYSETFDESTGIGSDNMCINSVSVRVSMYL